MWFEEESIQNWYNAEQSGSQGRSNVYSDMAIECMLALKVVFHLPLRATQGLVLSLVKLLKFPIRVPNYSTLSRRQSQLNIALKTRKNDEPLHAVFDSTGLKIFGEGEWKVRQHGYNRRRTWRKLHLGIDEATGEIIARALTTNDLGDGEILADLIDQIDRDISQASGDGAYDSFENYDMLTDLGAKVTIPPRDNCKIKQHGNRKQSPLTRDENIRSIRCFGRSEWKKQSGYHRRSISENAMFRFKTIFGSKLSAIKFENQATEAFIKCNVLNKMTKIGMPASYSV